MKHAIIIAMLAGSAMGQVSVVSFPYGAYLATNIVATNTLEIRHPIIELFTTNIVEISDEIIKTILTNGTVCRVRGKHEWVFIVDVDERPALRLSQHDKRKCSICARKETKHEVWKEDGR